MCVPSTGEAPQAVLTFELVNSARQAAVVVWQRWHSPESNVKVQRGNRFVHTLRFLTTRFRPTNANALLYETIYFYYKWFTS
jgi:hypothetical protein